MGRVTKFAFEAQLLRWTESSSGGATIVLQLADAEDLSIFKTMQLAKKGVVGQRLAVAVAEIGDDEKLVAHEAPKKPAATAQAHKFPGGLTGLAVRWCQDRDFQEWADGLGVLDPDDRAECGDDPEEVACRVINVLCRTVSRSELNTIKEAGERFDEFIRKPYAEHLAGKGG